jgi:hypothetical protein
MIHSPFLRFPQRCDVGCGHAEAPQREPAHSHARLLEVRRTDRADHHVLEGGGATCGLCGDRNPLGNLRRMPLEVLKAAYEISSVSFLAMASTAIACTWIAGGS